MPADATENSTQSDPPPRRRSLRRGVVIGAGIGAACATLLLFAFTVIVIIKMSMDSVHDAALSMTTFLFGIVCFGGLFVLICTFIGALVGLLRSRM